MKRWLPVITTVLLLSAGCTGPQGAQAVNTGSSQPGQVPAATQETEPLVPIPAVAVDYFNVGFDSEHQPQLPLTANACRTTATGALQLQVSDVRWRPHPLAPDKFWAPSAVVTACNGSLTQSGEQSFSVLRADGMPLGGTFFIMPGLAPGQALGPVRLYAGTGVTAKAGAFWRQTDGRLWPALTLQAGAGGPSYPVHRALGSDETEAPGGMPAPASPTLAQLRGLALDAVTFRSPDGQHQVELFLYDPNTVYTLTDMPWCGSLTGQVDAGGQHWSFWVSIDGAAPFLAGEAGSYDFPGERGLYKETATVGNSTYLYLEQYFGCANAHVTEVFAFDHSANTVTRSQMKLETGETMGAVGLVAQDGTLHRSYYANAGQEVGLHRLVYTWDAQARLWVTKSHEITRP